MTRRLFLPILLASLGLNLLFGYQNCGQVDPSFVYESEEKTSQAKAPIEVIPEPKRFVEASKVKILTSDLTRLQRKVRIDFEAEFRVKYSNHYIGLQPIVENNFELRDKNNNTIALIKADEAEILEKECVESVNTDMQTYFDCKYGLKITKDVDVHGDSLSKQKYKLANHKNSIQIRFDVRGGAVGEKTFKSLVKYVDKYVPTVKSTTKKMHAKIPAIKKKIVKKKKVQQKVAKSLPAKKHKPLKKKKIEPAPAFAEGVYCHIKVLNPPHLELLSDIKKVGSYYEDAETCREVALKVSKSYCGHSLMGELDINWSLKDKRSDGEKILDKKIESIECAS